MAALSALGLLMIYTVTAPRNEAAGLDPGGDMVRQAFFMAVGVVVFIVASLISDRQWKALAPYAYPATVLLLLAGADPPRAPCAPGRSGGSRWARSTCSPRSSPSRP